MFTPLRTALASLAVLSAALLGTGVAHADAPISIDTGGVGEGVFVADRFGDGNGLTDTKPANRVGLANWRTTHPVPASVMSNARYLENSYTVPGLTPGASYEVRLYFMEWYFKVPGQRVFDVAVNGTKVLTNFDILQTVRDLGGDGGAAFGIEKYFTVTADADGVLKIDFLRGSADQPLINALAVVPAA
ncbi:malectin domain-containing carbohydrate-binding protein [Kribbella antibiotica]|nr:malectin domain-containing carbohydrate-binding protein [Kribbella antibiotica]